MIGRDGTDEMATLAVGILLAFDLFALLMLFLIEESKLTATFRILTH